MLPSRLFLKWYFIAVTSVAICACGEALLLDRTNGCSAVVHQLFLVERFRSHVLEVLNLISKPSVQGIIAFCPYFEGPFYDCA
jgi:hypothetical protein